MRKRETVKCKETLYNLPHEKFDEIFLLPPLLCNLSKKLFILFAMHLKFRKMSGFKIEKVFEHEEMEKEGDGEETREKERHLTSIRRKRRNEKREKERE